VVYNPTNDVLRFMPRLVILSQVKLLNVKSDTVVQMFCLVVSNSSPFFATIVVPYNKLLDVVIVGAVTVVLVLPVIFLELIFPIVILIFEPNEFCLLFKVEEILDISYAKLLLVPYINVSA